MSKTWKLTDIVALL